MRSNRLWIGVTCGVALALGGVTAVDAGTQTAAGANVGVVCPDRQPPAIGNTCEPRYDKQNHPFTVSIDQHWIDQRIASAGVRASKRALKNALRKRLWVRLDNSSTKVITHQSWRKASGIAGPFTATFDSSQKFYTVDFKRNVSACSWTATPRGTTARFAYTDVVTDAAGKQVPTSVKVSVVELPNISIGGRVDVQVLC
jgi:hypothetical protein